MVQNTLIHPELFYIVNCFLGIYIYFERLEICRSYFNEAQAGEGEGPLFPEVPGMGQTEASQAPEGQGGGGEEGFDEEVEAFQESGRVFIIIGIYPVIDISRGRAARCALSPH